MKATLAGLLIGISMLLSPTLGYSKDTNITLYTGFQKGTYNIVGNDIAKVCSDMNIQIEPGGTIANMNSLINTPVFKTGYRFALVQKDAYDALVGPLNPKPIKRVLTLFPEEIVVLVNKNKGIKSIEGLHGKRVAGGASGSGIWFTSTVIEKTMGIKWLNVDRTPEEAILLTLTGEIDAMVVVGSSPLRLFQELPISFSQYIDVLPLQGNPKLNKVLEYDAVIPSNTYIWQKADIKTKSTLTYLVASDDVPDKVIKEVQTCITKNLPALKKLGHQKWNQMK